MRHIFFLLCFLCITFRKAVWRERSSWSRVVSSVKFSARLRLRLLQPDAHFKSALNLPVPAGAPVSRGLFLRGVRGFDREFRFHR